ncbi:MAG TPA: M20/M25/M40 family metallo-hydrolase [Anaerolineaceae bacterium]|nr:M20/M25/M40 family metallo-hydrolase [Anaerolineaceae bacterium]
MKKTRLTLLVVTFVLLFTVPTTSATSQTPTCPSSPTVQEILNQVTEDAIIQWIRNFSGEDFVPIGVSQRKILTRYSYQLFNMNVNAMAYPYLGEQLESFGYEQGTFLTDHSFSSSKIFESKGEIVREWIGKDANGLLPLDQNITFPDQSYTWKNKIVSIPGHGPNADEIVLMTAHLDSTSTAPVTNAPGAEDNASGVAALMEAARLFRFYQFDRTIKIIFFTGEEQGLLGSVAYVADYSAELPNIIGVVNLDMFGYDSDDDRCFELHVGTLPDSNMVGTCFTDVINNYGLNLTYDYLTNGATGASDHAPFWYEGVGAVEVLENYYNNDPPLGCIGQDRNPNYHHTTDLIQHMSTPVTHSIAQAGIGTAASLAAPIGRCFAADPDLTATPLTNSILLTWPGVVDADVYNVYRSDTSCEGIFTQVAQVTANSYEDTDIVFGHIYFYKVQAAETGAVCFSQLSNCASAEVEEPVFFDFYIPLVIAGE